MPNAAKEQQKRTFFYGNNHLISIETQYKVYKNQVWWNVVDGAYVCVVGIRSFSTEMVEDILA